MELTKEIASEYKNYLETYEGDISEISNYTSFGEGAALVLSEIDESLNIGINELSEDDAKTLIQHKSGLYFESKLFKASTNIVEILVKYDGELQFNQLLVSDDGKAILDKRDDSEYYNYVTNCNEEFVNLLIQDSYIEFENGYLECPTVAKKLIDALAKDQDFNTSILSSFNFISVEALREISKYPGEIQLDWGEKLDTQGNSWSDEHFEAIGNCAGPLSLGCGGFGEEPSQAISAKQLMSLRNQDLTLQYITALDDSCHESIKGRKGALYLPALDSISPSVAEALSTINCLEVGNISELNILTRLTGSNSSTRTLSISTKYISDDIGKALSSFEGNLKLTGAIYISQNAAKLLSGKIGSLDFGHVDSIYIEDNGAEYLEQHLDSANWPEEEIYDEDGEWQNTISWVQNVNKIIEEDDIIFHNEDDYTWCEKPDRPLISDTALKKLISEKQGDLQCLRSITDEQAIIISGAKEHTDLGVLKLNDQQIDSLLKIKSTISLSNLVDVSNDGALKLINSKKVVHLEGELGRKKANIESDIYSDESDDDDDETSNNVYFNYGRLKSRLESGDTTLGGPLDLLEEIENEIKSGSFPYKSAKIEYLLGKFFLACAEGEDTSSIKEEIEELFWEQ